MIYSSAPFAAKKFKQLRGRKMAYIDEGVGDAIVFAHGNGSSSYLWRNIMPACAGLGRLIACDMIGMGDSEKLPSADGPHRYDYPEHRKYLHDLWDALDLGDKVIFVVHDFGSTLGLDWALHHSERVQGIAYMESLVMPLSWGGFPKDFAAVFKALRSPAGEEMILQNNDFIEKILFGSIQRPLSEAEKTEYRRPFMKPGEDRRPTLSWPRHVPIDGEPPVTHEITGKISKWMSSSPVPKLYLRAVPGGLDSTQQAAFSRTFPNQKEVEVGGVHWVQEDSADAVSSALADFVRSLRNESS